MLGNRRSPLSLLFFFLGLGLGLSARPNTVPDNCPEDSEAMHWTVARPVQHCPARYDCRLKGDETGQCRCMMFYGFVGRDDGCEGLSSGGIAFSIILVLASIGCTWSFLANFLTLVALAQEKSLTIKCGFHIHTALLANTIAAGASVILTIGYVCTILNWDKNFIFHDEIRSYAMSQTAMWVTTTSLCVSFAWIDMVERSKKFQRGEHQAYKRILTALLVGLIIVTLVSQIIFIVNLVFFLTLCLYALGLAVIFRVGGQRLRNMLTDIEAANEDRARRTHSDAPRDHSKPAPRLSKSERHRSSKITRLSNDVHRVMRLVSHSCFCFVFGIVCYSIFRNAIPSTWGVAVGMGAVLLSVITVTMNILHYIRNTSSAVLQHHSLSGPFFLDRFKQGGEGQAQQHRTTKQAQQDLEMRSSVADEDEPELNTAAGTAESGGRLV